MDNQSKGQFNSNFGFLMATLGSAVGLGNLWGFPYKMGLGGGFAFLLIYVLMLVAIGYPLLLSEIAIGRKSQKAAIEAYREIHPAFAFNGVLQTAVPFFLIAFYCTIGGYVIKYLIKSLGMFAGNKFDPGELLGETVSGNSTIIWMILFVALTVVIVLGGVSGGIEKFCKIAMPALFIMLVLIVIRSCTLPGAGAGLAFLFKPHAFEAGIFETIKLAGSAMFFSLSLASGCLIAYGSYLGKEENLEKDAVFVVIGDTVAALLAGVAILPACSAYGLEFTAGPPLLFVSMPTVFNDMTGGAIFAFIFWLLVFFACLSSSIGMMEGGISAILDSRIKAGKSANRFKVTMIMGAWALIGNLITTLDGIDGSTGKIPWSHILGQGSALDVWDALGEGILMPLTGLIMAILVGWVVPHYIDDEVESSCAFKSKGMYNLCIKWLGPIFMVLILIGQVQSFFFH